MKNKREYKYQMHQWFIKVGFSPSKKIVWFASMKTF